MPAAAIITEPFAFKTRWEAEALGVGAVPIVVLPHPLGQSPVDEVHRETDWVAEEVLAAVTEPAQRVREFYRGRVARAGEPGLKSSASARHAPLA